MALHARPLAVVTDACSELGFALAHQLAEEAFDLVVVADEPSLEDAAEQLRAAGARVHAVQVDLGDADGCAQLELLTDGLERPIELLALHAGPGAGGDFARETGLCSELNLLRRHIVTTVRLTKWATRRMVAHRHGGVLVSVSTAALLPAPNRAVFGASQAFLLSFAASLHHELEAAGVTVTALLTAGADPRSLARQGLDGLRAGRERVIAGELAAHAAHH